MFKYENVWKRVVYPTQSKVQEMTNKVVDVLIMQDNALDYFKQDLVVLTTIPIEDCVKVALMKNSAATINDVVEMVTKDKYKVVKDRPEYK